MDIRNQLSERLRRLGVVGTGVAAAVLMAMIAMLDIATGTELSFSLFYLAPISIFAWRAGLGGGVAASGLGAVTWYQVGAVGGQTFSHPMIPVWNAFIRLGFFLVVCVLLTQLRHSIERERALARADHLTGLANRRTFEESASMEIERAHRTRRPITFAFMDLDGFKAVNDTLGHAAGDAVLTHAAQVIELVLRAVDVKGRIGGDEFAVVMPDTDLRAATQAVDRLSVALDAVGIASSIGVAVFEAPPESLQEAMSIVDSLMYETKTGLAAQPNVRVVGRSLAGEPLEA